MLALIKVTLAVVKRPWRRQEELIASAAQLGKGERVLPLRCENNKVQTVIECVRCYDSAEFSLLSEFSFSKP
jgi:lambda repressor-like predicted transcriptional regulator